ncbi:site-specific integrase [Streptomyces prunicolor]|uniref:site-specific integrase n=1 Tax=Streptomyces prunicolor TaxID=67348 RepID=UPI00036A2C45|nr:site-specific integrase [Streptomyces prunicolor]
MSGTRRAGSITRRCNCRDGNRKRLGKSCPQLAKRSHGTYQLQQEIPPGEDGTRRIFRRTGYPTVKDAQSDLDKVRAILDLAGDDEDAVRRVSDLLAELSGSREPLPDPAEVSRKLGVGVPLDGKTILGDWLDRWMAGKKTRPTTSRGYQSQIRYHLKPKIGHLRLDRIAVGHLADMFAKIADESDVIRAENQARREQERRARWGKPGRPPVKERERLAAERAKLAEMKPYRKANGPATRQAIRRTLRTALNAAIAQQMITFNAAAHVELDAAARPTGLLWTPERVARWRETGDIPSPVMVWTPQQLGEFLDAAEGHRLYSIYHVIGHHGLRRGEAVGAGWDNAHLDGRPPRLDVLEEIVMDGSQLIETAPKTDQSMAAVVVDRETVQVLKDRRRQQRAERKAWNAQAAEKRERGEEAYDWLDTGKIWTAEDGSWLHPDVVSREFDRIMHRAGLPPINLRDLRHCAAGLVKAGGGDIHDASKKLRHSTIVLTADTYTPLFAEYEEKLVEASAAAVPRARRRTPKAASVKE